jgi:peptidoglycan/LPS O-acetylase OafA/YrhL
MTEPPRAGRPARLAALHGLRLVAALAVAVYHLTVAWRVDGGLTYPVYLMHQRIGYTLVPVSSPRTPAPLGPVKRPAAG